MCIELNCIVPRYHDTYRIVNFLNRHISRTGWVTLYRSAMTVVPPIPRLTTIVALHSFAKRGHGSQVTYFKGSDIY